MTIEKKHRLHVIIEDDDFWQEWNRTISWGLRQHLIKAIMRLAIEAVKRDGGLMIGALIAGHFKLVIDDEAKANAGRRVGYIGPILEPENNPGPARSTPEP
jgi:hypothetical protein